MNFAIIALYNSIGFFSFAFQIVAGEILFGAKLKRKNRFWLRALVCVVVLLAVIYPFGALHLLLLQYPMVGMVAYFLYFCLTICAMQICYCEKLQSVIFCGVASYVLQNLSYRIMSIFEATYVIARLCEHINFMLAYLLFNYGIFALTAVAVYFVFARRMNKMDSTHLQGLSVLIVSALMLTVTILLCSWTNMYSWQHMYLLVINYVFSILCCLFILYIQSGMLNFASVKYDLEVVEQLWEQDRRQYELAKENIDIVNVKCHDLKHKIKALRLADGDISQEELKEIENAVSIYDAKIQTGCEPLDVILTEKSLFCNNHNIHLTSMADGSKLTYMSKGELYSLFGNLLSNAIESVSKIEDTDKRIIDFTVMQKNNMVLIQANNYYCGEITFSGGFPQSTKQNKTNHGFGIKSIKMLVEKYGGDINISAESGVFSVKILLPVI